MMTHHACRPSPKAKCLGDILTAECPVIVTSPFLLQPESFEKRKPSNRSGFEYISLSIWIALEGIAISVPAGMITPLENVNGRSARRAIVTSKKVSVTAPLWREAGEPRPIVSIRWVSRTKLSSLCILSIPAVIQPSSATAAWISRRRGSTYSGYERRRYNICVNVCDIC